MDVVTGSEDRSGASHLNKILSMGYPVSEPQDQAYSSPSRDMSDLSCGKSSGSQIPFGSVFFKKSHLHRTSNLDLL